MDKQGFLASLREGLRGLPPADIEERAAFYDVMIDDRMEEGLTEAQAVAELGSVESVIAQIAAETPLVKLVKEKVRRERKRSGKGLTTVLLALGRLLPKPFYQNYLSHDPRNLTLRRLYHQRVYGIIALAVAAALMLTPADFYFGLWVGRSSWMLPFVFFVVVEVYTAFRIPRAEKD